MLVIRKGEGLCGGHSNSLNSQECIKSSLNSQECVSHSGVSNSGAKFIFRQRALFGVSCSYVRHLFCAVCVPVAHGGEAWRRNVS